MSLLSEIEKHGLADCEFNRQLMRETKMILKANDTETWLETIWDALHKYRDKCIPEGELAHDDEWSDICTAMAWIAEDMEVDSDE
jgi:hypothetical protein